MKIFIYFLSIFVFLAVLSVNAQTTANYTVAANSTASLNSMTGSVTLLGANQQTNSAVANIGFDFWFMGVRYTQFSVNTNGVLRFGSTPVVATGNTPAIAGNSRLCVIANNVISTAIWKTSGTGKVHYVVTGTAPNRILTVEWLNLLADGDAASAGFTFQARIRETAPTGTNQGFIEFVYGGMVFQNHTDSFWEETTVRCGIGSGDAANEFIYIYTANHPNVIAGTDISRTIEYSSTYSGAVPLTINLNGAGAARKRYTFTSVTPSGTANNAAVGCTGATSANITWTDGCTNEVGYVLFKSTDGVNFTFDSQVAAGSTSAIVTGLTASTNYFFRVYAVTEGVLSNLSATGSVTFTTAAAGTFYSIASGNWNDAAIWSGGVVPGAGDNVVIGCTSGNTVTVNTATAACNHLTINSGSNLTISNNNKIVINGDLLVNDGGSLPKITMTSTNPTLELKGHWIDLDATIVAAPSNGVLNPGTSSTVIFSGTSQQIINTNNATPSIAAVQTAHPLNFYNLVVNASDMNYMFQNDKGCRVLNDLTVNAGKTMNYYVSAIAGGTYSLGIAGNMINNGTLNNAITAMYTSMSGIAKTITGTGIYTNFPLQISTGGTISLNTTASMRRLLVQTGASYTVSAGNTYTLTRSLTGGTSVDIDNSGTLNFSGANIVLGSPLDVTPTGNLINTGTFNAGTNSNFTFSAAGAQNVSNTAAIAASSTVTYINNSNIAIPDDSPVGGIAAGNTIPTAAALTGCATCAYRQITVPPGSYTGLNSINFSVSHTWTEDVDIYLLAPNGTVYLISTDNGGSADHYTNTTISDAGATNITAGTPPYTGTYKPELGTFASYPAASVAGNWRLYAVDDAAIISGTLSNFSITLNQAAAVSGTNLAFHNLISNNTSATGTTLLNTGIVINNATTFTSGRIYTSEDYRVNYIAGASTSLAASNSYVVGWIRKIGNTTFEFPLGNDDGGTNRYAAPIRFEPTAAAALTDHFTATYRRVSPNIGSAFDGLANPNVTPYDNVPPYFRNLHEAGIDHISNVEYWILERTNGSATGTVTLSYDNVRSGGAAYPADLLVCRYDKTTPIWQNKGNSSTSSGGGFTYVTSNAGAFTAFSPVTLGSTIDLNILPLSWLSFDAKRNGDDAVLKWNTQSEIRNEYFDIERSIDGFNFQSVGTQKAKMQSYEEKQYEWRDEKAALAAPLLYYRLKQVDMDGQFSYSKIRSVRFDENALNFVAFPNPFSDVVEVNFYTEKAEDVQIDITDVSGRSLRQFSFRWHAGGLSEKLDVSELPAGVYVFSLKTATEAYKQKLIKK